jgi:hypothetical protein
MSCSTESSSNRSGQSRRPASRTSNTRWCTASSDSRPRSAVEGIVRS